MFIYGFYSEIGMEIIPINGESVKIRLTRSDVEDFRTPRDEKERRESASRRIVRRAIESARAFTGFDAAGGCEVRMLESKDGGCELFIKKTNLSSGGRDMAYAKENYRISPEKTERAETVSYGFDCLDDLACACRQLSAKGFRGESRVYFEPGERGKYFLVISDVPRQTSSRLLKPLSFLAEFGQRCDYICADSYIKEHFGCICDKDAVKIIAENC